jgi:hypothetical protein
MLPACVAIALPSCDPAIVRRWRIFARQGSERHLTTREPTSSRDSLATSQLDPYRSGNCGLLVRLWGGVAGVTRCVAKGCHAVCTPLAYDPRSVVPS